MRVVEVREIHHDAEYVLEEPAAKVYEYTPSTDTWVSHITSFYQNGRELFLKFETSQINIHNRRIIIFVLFFGMLCASTLHSIYIVKKIRLVRMFHRLEKSKNLKKL